MIFRWICIAVLLSESTQRGSFLNFSAWCWPPEPCAINYMFCCHSGAPSCIEKGHREVLFLYAQSNNKLPIGIHGCGAGTRCKALIVGDVACALLLSASSSPTPGCFFGLCPILPPLVSWPFTPAAKLLSEQWRSLAWCRREAQLAKILQADWCNVPRIKHQEIWRYDRSRKQKQH